MKIGIIVEYNPFHNGHIYQINEIKKIYKDCFITVVMSSSITMRGEISLLNKWQKTNVALNNGVDLVIELPSVFCQSADTFSFNAVKLLNEVGIDVLVFGSESDDILKLIEIAKVQLNNRNFDNLVKTNMDKGLNYPTSLSNAIYDLTGLNVNTPNDILAVSYIKSVLEINDKIIIKSIKRSNDYNDLVSDSDIVSASNIRNKYLNNLDFKNSVPIETYNYLKQNNFDFNLLFNLIKYNILINKDDLSKFHLVDESICSRLYNSALTSSNLNELILNVKTKRYTYNRISRILLFILFNITKTEANNFKLEYIRVLGMNKKGKEILKSAKKLSSLPILTKFKNGYKLLDYELRVTTIYSMILNNPELIKDEYNSKVIIK